MNSMQRIQNLIQLMRARIPGVTIDVDAPNRPNGDWFVDLKVGDQSLVVVLRPALGFGLSSTPTDGMGEGPDELHANEESVVERIAGLLSSASRTQPQRVRLLQELREKKLVSQNAMAGKLGVRQPTISKIERREDVNVSTLRRYVRALGGELYVSARFGDGEVEIVLGPNSGTSKAEAQSLGKMDDMWAIADAKAEVGAEPIRSLHRSTTRRMLDEDVWVYRELPPRRKEIARCI